jgi:hypothetical protein
LQQKARTPGFDFAQGFGIVHDFGFDHACTYIDLALLTGAFPDKFGLIYEQAKNNWKLKLFKSRQVHLCRPFQFRLLLCTTER